MTDTITITFERLHPVCGVLSARRSINVLLLDESPDLQLLALKEECVVEVEALERRIATIANT